MGVYKHRSVCSFTSSVVTNPSPPNSVALAPVLLEFLEVTQHISTLGTLHFHSFRLEKHSHRHPPSFTLLTQIPPLSHSVPPQALCRKLTFPGGSAGK